MNVGQVSTNLCILVHKTDFFFSMLTILLKEITRIENTDLSESGLDVLW